MRYIFIIFLTFFSQKIYTQAYTSKWYNIDNGLSQNSIKDIVKDKYGFLWFSTENGLVRYDGLSFSSYNKFPVNNLSFDSFIGNVLKNKIVILNAYERNEILIKDRIPKIIRLNKGDKQITQEKNIQYQRLVKNIINGMNFDNIRCYIKLNSDIYSFHNNYILYIDGSRVQKKIPINFNNNDLKNIFVNKQTLYITDPIHRKVYKVFKGKITTSEVPTLINDPNTKIYWQQITDQTFIINGNNIYLLQNSEKGLDLRHLIKYEDIGHIPFNCMYYDKDFNRLYLGSLTKGLNIIQLSQFHIVKKNIPFSSEVYYGSLPFSKNTIITEEGIEFSHDGVVKEHHFGDNNDKYGLLYDNSKNILIINKNRIIRFHSNSSYKISDTLRFKKKIAIFSKNKDLYGLTLINEQNKCFFLIFKNDQFKNPEYVYKFKTFVNTFLQYKKNELLVGCSEGLYLISLQKKLVKNINSKLNVKSIVQTTDGNIWITTRDGFFLFKNGNLIKMPNDKNNYLNSAHSILEDFNGYFWIPTNNGLFKVQKKQLLQFAEYNKKVHYYRFVKENGFLTNEFNGGYNPSAYSLQNGEFVFPSIEGIVFFTPGNVKTYYPDKNNIYIERARINNGEISNFENNLMLENDYKTADILIDIPYYSNSDNLQMEAKIDGVENSKWEQINTGTERKYTINNLGPGNYTLYIRVLISDKGNYEYRHINLSIKPLFYQTIAFKILLIIVLLAIIITIIQLRTNFLRIKNRTLEEIVNNKSIELEETSYDLESTKKKLNFELDYQEKLIKTINHDITTPVKFITFLSQKVNEMDDIELQKKYFNHIYQSAEELYKFTITLKEYTQLYKDNEINRNERINIYEIIKAKSLLFKEIANQNETVIYNNVDQKLIIRINKTIFSAIIHNLLDNAIKNTPNGAICFINNSNNTNISIQISDTGTGMSEEQMEYYNNLGQDLNYTSFTLKKIGIGLHLVIHLIQKINCSIKFAHNLPHGTVVTLKLN